MRRREYGWNYWELPEPPEDEPGLTVDEAAEREADAYGDYLCDLMMEGEL